MGRGTKTIVYTNYAPTDLLGGAVEVRNPTREEQRGRLNRHLCRGPRLPVSWATRRNSRRGDKLQAVSPLKMVSSVSEREREGFRNAQLVVSLSQGGFRSGQ